MDTFKSEDILKMFGPLLEGTNLDKKYPSAYLPKFIQKIVDFINWAISYINDRVGYLEERMDGKFAKAQKQMDSADESLKDQKSKIDEINKSIKDEAKKSKDYTDDAIKKLRKDLGI
jgi:hypothetical protein